MRARRLPKLQRRGARREPKRRFVVFCEGRNTEPIYFEAIRRSYSSTLIDVEIRGGVGVPYTIAQEAIKYAEAAGLTSRSRRRRSSFERGDQVWVVFDGDNHPNFDQAVTICESNGIGVARSNPCFELWLILHESICDRPDSRHAMQKTLEELRPEYDKDGGKVPDCDDLVTRVETAEGRAETLLRRRAQERNSYGNPSTTVGHLTRRIREADASAR